VDKRAARLGALALVSVILLGAVGTRLWFLQTVERQSLQAKVNSGQTRTQQLLPERGRIFDVWGRILADNRRILTVTVDRSVIRRDVNRKELFTRLSGILNVTVEDMEKRYDDNRYSNFLPLPVAEDVAETTVVELESRSEDFPGVRGEEDWVRVYPYAPLASHVIGYMGLILAKQEQTYRDLGYLNNETVGQFGVELSMEQVLHGKSGLVTYQVDSANRVVREVSRIEPVPGKDVRLTIDLKVQQYAERVLETELRSRRQDTNYAEMAKNPKDKDGKPKFIEPEPWRYDENGDQYLPFPAPAGSIVVENYANGQIVAMASYPTFDNRWFTVGLSGAKFKQLFPVPDKNDPNRADKSILVNRAIQGQYNLGSTFKPFVAYSGMMAGVIKPDEIYDDTGSFKLNIDKSICDTGVRCEYFNALSAGTGKPAVYGPVTVSDALAVSSDAFFYHIGELTYLKDHSLLGNELRQFGFGAKSGIDLPFEFTGRIPTAELKAELIKKGVLLKSESPRLLEGDNVQLAIGQGLLASSPLQLANAYSTLANGGFLFRPHIVAAIYQGGVPDGETAGYADLGKAKLIQSFEKAEVVHQLDFPDSVVLPIIEGLQRVIYGRGVTSSNGFYHATTGESVFKTYAQQATISLAGKTGTAQGSASKPWFDSSVFAAFHPEVGGQQDSTPYTVVAYLEKAGYGAKASAPVVKCMFAALGNNVTVDDVKLSDPLDQNAVVAAPSNQLADPACLAIPTGAAVRD
ncbi:MAG: pbpA, partial [Ilumatobacteraceae bacterium]|nr:pbpA [Ilumatobacteraceae bacterium]